MKILKIVSLFVLLAAAFVYREPRVETGGICCSQGQPGPGCAGVDICCRPDAVGAWPCSLDQPGYCLMSCGGADAEN